MSAAGQLAALWAALGGPDDVPGRVAFTGSRAHPSRYPVTDFAAATVACAGAAVTELVAEGTGDVASVNVDRVQASAWFGQVNRPIGWTSTGGNPLTGEYRTRDERWIRFQLNYPRHVAATLATLGCAPTTGGIAAAVRGWDAQDLEDAVVAGGGAAAVARSTDEWAAHPQGVAVAGEPLVDVAFDRGESARPDRVPLAGRPLAGIRVLDLTRVLAGPMATRFLASYGADVLRIDPPGYDEPRGAVLVTLGKRCTRLDLRAAEGRTRFLELLAGADVLVHGYRDGVLDALGLDGDQRAATRPGLVEVTLNAYGWTGPWRGRRGFDTIVEMSTGMAEENRRWAGGDRPVLLPVQALDHGTGHLMAAAAVRGLTHRLRTGQGSRTRCALARTAGFLAGCDPVAAEPPITAADVAYGDRVHATPRGPALRMRPPLAVERAPQYWDRPGEPFGASMPVWPQEV